MPLLTGTMIPSLEEATVWINSAANVPYPSPTLVQFWAISCPICKMNMPRLQEFLDTYREHGLQLISVHMPRSEADMDVEKVKAAVQELGLTGP